MKLTYRHSMNKGEFDLSHILEGCRMGDRNHQRKLYEHFYGYAMSICLRYAHSRESAVEILNDAFFKVLTRLDQYNATQAFKPWLRRILIHAAVDDFRKHRHIPPHLDLTEAESLAGEDLLMPELSPETDLLPALQQLPPAYRTVFNLYVMEEYSHAEIAGLLQISASASRSNLARACARLRTILPRNTTKPVKANT